LAGSFSEDIKSGVTQGLLSADGRRTVRFDRKSASAWAREPHQELSTWDFTAESHEPELLRFIDAERFLAVVEDELVVWNVVTGEINPRIQMELNRFAGQTPTGRALDGTKFVVSPDGQYVAILDREELQVLRLSDGEVAAKCERPKAFAGASFPDDAFLAFSPEADELAIRFDRRVICWNHKGQVCFETELPESLSQSRELVPLPGQRGWLMIHDWVSILDRQAEHIVARFRKTYDVFKFDGDRLFALRPHAGNVRLTGIDLPWKQIDDSLRAMRRGEALLAGGKALSLAFEFGDLRFDNPSQVESTLRDALESVTAKHGFHVRPGQPVVVRVSYHERAGEDVVYVERRILDPPKPSDPTATVNETVIRMNIALEVNGTVFPLWSRTLEYDASFLIEGAVTDQTARDATFENVVARDATFENVVDEIEDIEFPYFIPEDPTLLTLPLIIRFDAVEK
jgi:hypothetical protein